MTDRKTNVYYLTRNTNCQGELSPSVEVWYEKPHRMRLNFDKGFVWFVGDINFVQGAYGSYSLETATRIFKTIPDTDIEMIKCEQYAQ